MGTYIPHVTKGDDNIVTIEQVLANANGLVRFTYTADAMGYFRKTSKVKGEPDLADIYTNGIVKVSEVVASVTLSQSYEREVMASALRQGIDPAEVTTLVQFAAQGLNGMQWVEGHEGLLVANAEGKVALRAYPASGTDKYGIEPPMYINKADNTEVTYESLEHYHSAPRKPSYLKVNGVELTAAGGTPIKKVTPHYYFLEQISNLRSI